MALDKIPKDAMMLLSFVNTRMRDEGLTLEELSEQFDIMPGEIEEKLDSIGYKYDSNLRKFI